MMNREAMESLGDRIAEHAAHLDAATHRLLTDLRTFDQAGCWYQQGARSCAQWLSWRVGWDPGTAREHVRVANRLGDLPQIDEALRRGHVSYAKVRAMTRVATQTNEAMLLEQARFSTGAQLETICRKYAVVQRHNAEVTPEDDGHRRHVSRHDTADGMVRIEAVLHPEEAAIVWAALDRAATESCRNPGSVHGVVPRDTRDDTPTPTAASTSLRPHDVSAETPSGRHGESERFPVETPGVAQVSETSPAEPSGVVEISELTRILTALPPAPPRPGRETPGIASRTWAAPRRSSTGPTRSWRSRRTSCGVPAKTGRRSRSSSAWPSRPCEPQPQPPSPIRARSPASAMGPAFRHRPPAGLPVTVALSRSPKTSVEFRCRSAAGRARVRAR